MVNSKLSIPARQSELATPAELPEEKLNWCTISLEEVFQRGNRLEASVFGIDGKQARETLSRCKWPLSQICGASGLATAYYGPRFKRVLVDKSPYPIYKPSQINEINPIPSGYLSPLTKTDIEALKVHKGQILLTRSGTIGNCALVNRTLDNHIFSDDVIRITCKSDIDVGYIYAFLRTKIGNVLIRTNEYGAVVSHIEPEHLQDVPIPNPPNILKRRIHNLVAQSYELRDKSNELLKEAQDLLYDELKMPALEHLKIKYFDRDSGMRNFAAKLSELDGRLDASCHMPIVNAILNQLMKEALEVIRLDDARICKQILLPGRFARVYVQKGQGAVYFTGKDILELDPTDKKYLAFSKHANRIKEELTIRHNMILVTCSGTLGLVVLCPKHWDGWVMTHDIIRIIPTDDRLVGFVSVYLSSDIGRILLKRHSYGAVVPHIEDHHIAQVKVPLLKDQTVQTRINSLALEANDLRAEAYHHEQDAIRIVNDKVINAYDD